jgi:addiction module RelE/StbE family toxin
MYKVTTTSHFDRQFRRFQRAQPHLKQRIAEVLLDLREDPNKPRLRLHALHGEFEGLSAVRVTYSFRILLTIDPATREIRLVDIGSHDEVY